jgi:DNA-binding winged helix-turn-helix (wHTH) protein
VIVRFGAFELDADRRQLARGGDEVHLTPKAFDLLLLLIEEAPRVVRKAEFHARLWGGTFVSDATLVSLIKEVRRALDDRDAQAPIVRTAHGVGYAFEAPFRRERGRPQTAIHWVVVGGRRVALVEGENVIGRDPAATVCLDVAGVSRHHARIVVGERDAMLEDLGSKNGTRVAETPVSKSVALRDGDQIQVGPVLVIFHASASGMSTETLSQPLSR